MPQNFQYIEERYPGAFIEEGSRTYILMPSMEEGLIEVEISNFICRISQKIIDDEEKISWNLEVSNPLEKQVVEFKGKELVNLRRFRENLGDKGIFLYHLTNTRAHNSFIEYLFKRSTFPTVRKTQYLGRIDPKIFLFCNAMASTHGIESIEGIFIPPAGKLFYAQTSLSLKDVIHRFLSIYDTQAWKALGFAVGSLFVEEISENFGFYPILFLYGRKGSGKNTLAEILSAFFGAHREIRPFNFNSTEKSKQRAGARYRGIPITVNEYQNNTKNNMIISSFYDREGYHRAKTTESLDIYKGELNSSLMVLSTQDIAGREAEAVLSRLVEIDMDAVKRRKEEVDEFRKLKDEFSIFVEHCMKSLSPEDVLDSIRKAISSNLKIQADTRIIENYSILQGAANILLSSLGLSEFVVEDIEEEILVRDEVTREANAVENFLNLLEVMLLRGSKRITAWAKMVASTRELIFSLEHTYPVIGEEAKRAGMEIPGQRTIKNKIKSMGARRKTVRINKQDIKAWSFNRHENTEAQQNWEEKKNEGVEAFLSTLEALITEEREGIEDWAKIQLDTKSPRKLVFNLKHAYPLVANRGASKKVFIPDEKTVRRVIKERGATKNTLNLGKKPVKVWVLERELKS